MGTRQVLLYHHFSMPFFALLGHPQLLSPRHHLISSLSHKSVYHYLGQNLVIHLAFHKKEPTDPFLLNHKLRFYNHLGINAPLQVFFRRTITLVSHYKCPEMSLFQLYRYQVQFYIFVVHHPYLK